MGKESKIEWTDHTFNPWIGCTKVSPGCANCYAETLDRNRFSKTLGIATKDAPVAHWGEGAPRHRTSTSAWKQPLKWNKTAICTQCGYAELIGSDDCRKCGRNFSEAHRRRPRVFCASLADWLDDEVPIEWLTDLLALIHATPNLDWQLLTKRPENWIERIGGVLRFADAHVPRPSTREHMEMRADIPGLSKADWEEKWRRFRRSETGFWLGGWLGGTPPHNIWLGTTVEDQARADERIPALLKIAARVRFLSCEPLLGPVDIPKVLEASIGYNRDGSSRVWSLPGRPMINWVICGGESGHGASPMHPDWARSLRDQCAAAGAPFLFKQWGEWVGADDADEVAMRGYEPRDRHHWPCGQYSYRFSKSISGRLLDGVEHNAFPQ